MSISILVRRCCLLLGVLAAAAVLAGPLTAKEPIKKVASDDKKPTVVQKETKADRSATPSNAQQADRTAKPSQDAVTGTATTEPSPITPDSPQPLEIKATPLAGEQIKWQVLSGGGSMNGTSTNFRLSGTVGQVAVGLASSTNFKINQGFWQDFGTAGAPTCCVGETGDVNSDGNSNLTDLTLLVNQLFVTFVPVPCLPEANTNGDAACDLTLTDLTLLVNKLFVTFEPTAQCTDFDNSGC